MGCVCDFFFQEIYNINFGVSRHAPLMAQGRINSHEFRRFCEFYSLRDVLRIKNLNLKLKMSSSIFFLALVLQGMLAFRNGRCIKIWESIKRIFQADVKSEIFRIMRNNWIGRWPTCKDFNGCHLKLSALTVCRWHPLNANELLFFIAKIRTFKLELLAAV